MIWRPGKEFEIAPRAFDGVPLRSQDDDLDYLLDGQQRLTALIHALRPDYSRYSYFIQNFVRYLTAVNAPDIEDHIASLAVAQFDKKYPSLEARAENDVALISDIVSDENFNDWITMYKSCHPDPGEARYFELRKERVPGLKDEYDIPCVMLGERQELEAVARIFETTNKTGVKLGTVDLMVAKLYPSGFKLRDEWRAVQERHHDRLGSFLGAPDKDGPVDAEDALRILAYWSSKNRAERSVASGGKRGAPSVTKTAILRMKSPEVKESWSDGVGALVQALEFLRERCGIVQGSLLPARMMLVPLAVALHEIGRRDETSLATVERWFWSMVVTAEFARSTNTRAVRQARRLLGTLVASAEATLFWDEEQGETELLGGLRERLLDSGSGEQPLQRAVLAAVIVNGGYDWRGEQQELPEVAGTIEAHHVFPQGAKGVTDEWNVGCIANLTPQGEVSNRELKNEFPLDAGVTGEAAGPHFCDFTELGAKDAETFGRFLRRRASALADFLHGLAKGDVG